MVERVGFASLGENEMEKRDDFYIPEEVAEWVGLKKSEYLSKLIGGLVPGDIGFEEFHLFDSYVPGTIERPDKTYESSDDDQRIRTYIKTYSENSGFHQVVIGVLLDDNDRRADVFIPIITFVSRNAEVVKLFSVGTVIGAPTLS
jgi:hypothetical protein